VIPQICYPHAVRALGLPFEQTILDCLRHPGRGNRLTFECARLYGVDGLRVWPVGPAMDVARRDGVWHGVDPATGRIAGRVDFAGGGGVVPPEEACRSEAEILDEPPFNAEEWRHGGALDGIRAILAEAGDDFFVITTPGYFTVEYLTCQRGKAQALVDLVERPDFCHQAQERALEVAIQRGLTLARVGVDGLMIADVFGGVIGPRLFDEFCLPYFRRFVEAMRRSLGPAAPLIYMHVCGDSRRLFERMADTGVDCIEPLDCLGGVEVRDAKARVGRRVALMGGVNTVKLSRGSLDDVRRDIARCLAEGAPGGGYILACADMLPTETSPDKVRAMVEAAHAWAY
jgi:uroporphyrinogen-III decarboxylase